MNPTKTGKFIETENRLVVSRGKMRKPRIGSYCLISTDFLFGLMQSSEKDGKTERPNLISHLNLGLEVRNGTGEGLDCSLLAVEVGGVTQQRPERPLGETSL